MTEKKILRIVLSLILIFSVMGVILGIWGFRRMGYNYLDSCYETIRLFYVNPSQVDTSWQLSYAKWLILFAVILTIVRLSFFNALKFLKVQVANFFVFIKGLLEKVWKNGKKIIVITIVLLFLICIGFIWDYNRLKVEYYADYVDKWGKPEGIIKLNKSQVSKRNKHYRFESSQRKLRRVIFANSTGTPIDHDDTEYIDRPAIQELIYADNRLIITELKNSKNRTIVAYFWGGKDYDRIDIKRDKEGEASAPLTTSFTSIFFNLFSEIGGTKADIKRFKLTRNEAGYIIRKEFKWHNGDDTYSAFDAIGIWGFEYDLDYLGRPIEIRYLEYDEQCCCPDDGQCLPDNIGVAKRRYKYDDQHGNICKVEYLETNDKPILNELLWASRTDISDENGNIEETNYYGTDGKPCLHIDGYAKLILKYDKRGNEIERTFLGTEGQPYLNKNRVAKWNSKYDEKGYVIERTYFGTDGQVGVDGNNVSGWRSKYDTKGNCTEIMYFSKNGKPCYYKSKNGDNYSKLILGYDKIGNDTVHTFWDAEGQPCSGIAKYIYRYDESGNCTETSFFDKNDNPCVNTKGYTKFISEYNKRGNEIKSTSWGLDTISDADGILRSRTYILHGWEKKYDDVGNCTKVSFFDKDGKLYLNEDSIAGWWSIYNKKGNEIRRAYFDTNSQPCLNKYKVAGWLSEYDARGNRIKMAHFDTDGWGKPCSHTGGYAKWLSEYDERGNEIKCTFYGTDGQPCLNIYGVAGWHSEYNERGNCIKTAYFDTDGKPCLHKKYGFAKETIEYDERENEIKTIEYDEQDNKIRTY